MSDRYDYMDMMKARRGAFNDILKDFEYHNIKGVALLIVQARKKAMDDYIEAWDNKPDNEEEK